MRKAAGWVAGQSPDCGDAILVEPVILSDEWHSLHNGLRHQNTIERIFVQFGKAAERHYVGCPDRKRGDSRLDYVFLPP